MGFFVFIGNMEAGARQRSFWRFATVSLALYAAFTLWLICHHEPWRDEADPWLAARDMSLGELFRWFHYVGTPGLWNLILLGPAKLGMPYGSMSAIHWALAVATAGVVLFLAPFPSWVRFLLVFSYLLGFEYSVIARSYVLTVLICFLLAHLYAKRMERPIVFGVLLALMTNANAHGAIIAASVLVVAVGNGWRNRRTVRARHWVGVMIACAGLALAASQLLPRPADGQMVGEDLIQNRFAIFHMVARGYFHHVNTDWGQRLYDSGGKFSSIIPVIVAGIAGTVVLIVVIGLLAGHADALAIFALASIGLALLFMFTWMSGDRHTGLLWVVSVMAVWIAWEDEPERVGGRAYFKWRWLPARAGIVMLVLSMLHSTAVLAVTARKEILYAFSDARNVAEFLHEKGYDRQPIAAHQMYRCEAILPYLPGVKFWYVGLQRYGTYLPWDKRWEEGELLRPGHVMERFDREFPSSTPATLILTRPLLEPAKSGFVLAYQTTVEEFGDTEERYYVYRRADD